MDVVDLLKKIIIIKRKKKEKKSWLRHNKWGILGPFSLSFN